MLTITFRRSILSIECYRQTHFGSHQTIADVNTKIWMYHCRKLNRYWQVMQFPIFQRHHLGDSSGKSRRGSSPWRSLYSQIPFTPLQTNTASSLTEMQSSTELRRLRTSSPAVKVSDRWLGIPSHPTQSLPSTDTCISLLDQWRNFVKWQSECTKWFR